MRDVIAAVHDATGAAISDISLFVPGTEQRLAAGATLRGAGLRSGCPVFLLVEETCMSKVKNLFSLPVLFSSCG